MPNTFAPTIFCLQCGTQIQVKGNTGFCSKACQIKFNEKCAEEYEAERQQNIKDLEALL